MLHILALAASTSVEPIVTAAWLQDHLKDPKVHVLYIGDARDYDRAHIPGARLMDHMETVRMGADGHRLPANDVLAKALTQAGVADGVRVVLYGDSPMATAWVNTAIISIGHGEDVSWLDGGIAGWTAANRPTDTARPQPGTGPLTIRPAPDYVVDAAYVRSHLSAAGTKILDVRTDGEWKNGHLPNATLVLWQDLFADVKSQTFKSPEEIRALLAAKGVRPQETIVTYCAVGMRASLMAWAARVAGVDSRVYLGSWQDWSRSAENPIVK